VPAPSRGFELDLTDWEPVANTVLPDVAAALTPPVNTTFGSDTSMGQVLGQAYKGSNGLRGAYFSPRTIGAQPAVVRSVNAEAKGFCEVVVGTGATEGFTINASGSTQSSDGVAGRAVFWGVSGRGSRGRGG
jgi:hypothetical protein